MLLDQAGIDSIEVSGNGTSVSGIKAHVNEGYFVSPAARIADAVSCPVIVVGGFRRFPSRVSTATFTPIRFITTSAIR